MPLGSRRPSPSERNHRAQEGPFRIAAATRTIRLGTNIYLLPLRHPLLAARLAMSVDVLSGGRLTLGIGVGWLAEEFQAVASTSARARRAPASAGGR